MHKRKSLAKSLWMH